MAGRLIKAARRSGTKRDEISAAKARGDLPGAFHLARGWLASEMRKVEKQRPQDAPAIYAEVIEKLCGLAEALPTYRPVKREEGTNDAASGR